MFNKVKIFIKKEMVFSIAALCAVISAFLIPPSREYMGYIDWSVLALLFCLMAVVEGLREAGVLSGLSNMLLSKTKSIKTLGLALVLLCFFLAMLITNDVALITLVPLTIGILEGQREEKIIFIVVMETVAANLGSLATPIGNPQNLFLYSHYNMDIVSFLKITIPLCLISLILIIPIMLCLTGGDINIELTDKKTEINKKRAAKFIALFIVCLFTVLNILDYRLCFFIVLVVLFFTDRGVLNKVDYMLLFTFVCFFIFVGNISNINAVSGLVSKVIKGNEWLTAALLSQVISNVPAAVMLSSFTDNAKSLIMGTNIGGLGTLVASLASLISYRIYCGHEGAKKGKYLVVFSLINFILLFIFIVFTWFISR